MSTINQTVYFGVSKSHRANFETEIHIIRNSLKRYNISLEVFVDKYEFESHEAVEMMNKAYHEIDNCAFFIAELSNKAIGVGVEVGYAKAKEKPIIYLKKANAKYSTTVGGSANFTIEYKDTNHLQKEFDKVMKVLLNL